MHSYAFRSLEQRSVVLVNIHHDQAQYVCLTVGKVPARADAWVLTSAKITDWNEQSEVVRTRKRTITDFKDGHTMPLPPFSLTVVRWKAVA